MRSEPARGNLHKVQQAAQVGATKPDRTSPAHRAVVLVEDPAGRLLPGRAPRGRALRWSPEDLSPGALWSASPLRPVASAVLLRCRMSASVKGPSSFPPQQMASRLFLGLAFWSGNHSTQNSGHPCPADHVPMGCAPTLRTGTPPASILDLSFPWRHLGSHHIPRGLAGGCVPSEVSVATL